MSRPILTSEAFAPAEAKLFARTVEQYPPRRSAVAAIGPSLLGAAAFLACAFVALALFA